MNGKVTNNRIRWYGHVLRMNEWRIQKILNMKVKGNHPMRRSRSKWKQQSKYVAQEEGRTWDETEEQESCGKVHI
jgi:hypothetical protein